MKKRLLTTFLLLSGCLLSACNGNEEESEYDDPIYLEKDTSKAYDFADSSNENGSMNYEIFVRSFYDSNNDGIGDLNGVKEKLPYLSDMGFKSIWLMPIFPSPTYHGYDVTDYYSVNPDYGTLDDFTSLVEEAKKYNIDIMLDMVFNHCSSSNKYFTDSFNDYMNANTSSSSKIDWFNWSSSKLEGYNSYRSEAYYESRFDAGMPDFNLDSEGVRDEMEKITKFWIEKGVKGFRLDAVLYYYYQNTSKNVEFLNWLMDTAHKYDPDFYMVGETWVNDDVMLNPYYKSSCPSFFRFGAATGGGKNTINMLKGYGWGSTWVEEIEKDEKTLHEYNENGYSSYFLSNHDQDRIAKNFSSNMKLYKAAASLLTFLPGTSYVYYGEEIALKGERVVSPDDQSDVRRRLPMIWSEKDKTGECSFPEKKRQDLKDNEQVSKGVEDQLKDNFSLLNHYKMLIHIRNKYPFIKHAILKSRCDDLGIEERSVIAYSLTLGEESITIVHNFNYYNVEMDAPGTSILDEINTNRHHPKLENGKLTLGAYSSVIMR